MLTRNPDVKTTLLPDGHVVLFSTKTDWAHTLNPVGALVWEFCDGRHTTEEIISEVHCLVADIDESVLVEQVRAFIEELTESGLLQSAQS